MIVFAAATRTDSVDQASGSALLITYAPPMRPLRRAPPSVREPHDPAQARFALTLLAAMETE